MDKANSNTGTAAFKLIQTKQVAVFFCAFVLIYGLLMMPWPGWETAYLKFYRYTIAFVFKLFIPTNLLQFWSINDGEADIKIVFYNPRQSSQSGQMTPVGFIRHNSRHGGYICTAFLTALILATPTSLKRKGWMLLWGMVLIHLFIICKLGIWVVYGFNREPLSLLVLTPFWNRALLLIINVFVRNLTFGLIVAVFIWIFVSFRRQDWERIVATQGRSKKN